MSADNGVYILKTKGNPRRLNSNIHEYRVAHLQAIDNIDWDDKLGKPSRDHDVQIVNAREMWKGCKVFTDAKEALDEALKIDRECVYVEYGICEIEIPRRF